MSVNTPQRKIRGTVTSTETSGEFPSYLREHQFSVTLFDADGKPVTNATGKINIEVSDDGVNYGSIVSTPIDVSDPTYDRPTMTGYIKRVRVTPDSIVGAATYEVTVTSWR